ncbi:MAG: YkgJ family cysteine cluster protein [Phycisphaerales bacterium]|nr:YkgJ family cysteine cluster protein [Phycisphaerales bacterium]
MKLDVLNQPNDKLWYTDGLDFTCTQCGNCCTGGPGFVWISEVEIQRLAEHLQLSVEQVLKKYCRRVSGRISLKERFNQGNYDCVFLKEIPATRYDERAGRQVQYTKRICEIYNVRPLQCRTWPFWKENLQSPAEWKHATRNCPGSNRPGRHFSVKQIHDLRDAPDWPENPPSSET